MPPPRLHALLLPLCPTFLPLGAGGSAGATWSRLLRVGPADALAAVFGDPAMARRAVKGDERGEECGECLGDDGSTRLEVGSDTRRVVAGEDRGDECGEFLGDAESGTRRTVAGDECGECLGDAGSTRFVDDDGAARLAAACSFGCSSDAARLTGG